MKKTLNINSNFLLKYIVKSNHYRVRLGNTHLFYLPTSIGLYKDIIEKEILNEDHSSLKWAEGFCKKNKIKNTCIDDFAFMFHVFSSSYELDDAVKRVGKAELQISAAHNLLLKYKKDFNLIKGISFQIRANESIKIDNKEAILFILENLSNGFGIKSEEEYKALVHPQMKSPKTHDLKIFVSLLLEYLNHFTSYKAPKGIRATNAQCKIIYSVLQDAGFLKDRPEEDMDKTNYIRAYLKQASAKF